LRLPTPLRLNAAGYEVWDKAASQEAETICAQSLPAKDSGLTWGIRANEPRRCAVNA
jgi:hypothetical protein